MHTNLKGNKRKILSASLITTLLILLLTAYQVYTSPDSSGQVPGTLVYGYSYPIVSTPHYRYWNSDLVANASVLTVNTKYYIECDIEHGSGLGEIANVTVRISLNRTQSLTSDVVNQNFSFNENKLYYFCYVNSITNNSADDTNLWYNGTAWVEFTGSNEGRFYQYKSHTLAESPTTTQNDFPITGFSWSKVALYGVNNKWELRVIAYDRQGQYSGEAIYGPPEQYVRVGAYDEFHTIDNEHTWHGYPGNTSLPLDTPASGYVSFNVTCNYIFKIQCRGSGDLTYGANTVALSNVKFHHDTLGSAISMTTSYQNCGGLTNQAVPSTETLTTLYVTLWIDVPSGKPPGSYTYTLYIQITAN